MDNFTRKDHRHNLILNLFHEFTWGFGIAFHTVYATVPLFLKSLGAPDIIIVSTAGLFAILVAIPQLFSALMGRNIKNIKRASLLIHGIPISVVFMMGTIYTFYIPTGPNAWLYFYTGFIGYALAIGYLLPIWVEFLEHATLKEERGRFLGISFAINSVGGFIGGLTVKWVLDSSIPFPQNFGVGFYIFFFSITIGSALFYWFRMKERRLDIPHKTVKQFIADTKDIIVGHRNFQKYLLARIFCTATFPAMSLYAVYCQDKFGFEISEAGVFTVLNVIAGGGAAYITGKLGDKYGHKSSIILSYSGHLIAVLLAIFSQSMLWVYGIFFFLGIGIGSFMPASMNLVYDFAGDRDTKTYMALIDTILAPFVVLIIIASATLSSSFGPKSVLISVSGMLGVGLFLLIFVVKDPGTKRQIERFSS
ncbi:MAG: MFS transporter [Candidatus Marinimicrobia bacterium]|nr:MFS transporter [Candidatus Neomarinimicrobiota bacterium]